MDEADFLESETAGIVLKVCVHLSLSCSPRSDLVFFWEQPAP